MSNTSWSSVPGRLIPRQVSAGMISLCVHASVVVLLMLAAVLGPQPPSLPPHTVEVKLLPRLPLPMLQPQPDAGGGSNSAEPARKGKLPEVRPARPFVRPMVAMVRNPLLPIEIGIPDLPDIDFDFPVIGDPTSVRPTGQFGMNGLPGGIGDRKGPGVGSNGDRPGLSSRVAELPTKVTRPPRLLFKVEPEYSEAARKARYQGYVRLKVDVALDGRPVNIRVMQSLGLGLDEAAIEAVMKWRFQPAMAGDQPVVAPATIEVGFHLI